MRVDYVLRDDPIYYNAIDTVARSSEVCLVFVKVFLVEGWDREHLKLDYGGAGLIQRVQSSCAGQVVVILHAGGQVIVEDWVCSDRLHILVRR